MVVVSVGLPLVAALQVDILNIGMMALAASVWAVRANSAVTEPSSLWIRHVGLPKRLSWAPARDAGDHLGAAHD